MQTADYSFELFSTKSTQFVFNYISAHRCIKFALKNCLAGKAGIFRERERERENEREREKHRDRYYVEQIYTTQPTS